MSSAKQTFRLRELALSVYLPSFLFSAGESGLIPLLPASAVRLGADIPTAAMVAGAVLIGTLLADLPAAKFINRVGERRAMISAGLVAAISVFGAMYAVNLWMMGASVFLLGATASVFGLARHGYLTEITPFEYRARALSLLGGMFRLGSLTGPLLGALIVQVFGLQHLYWMTFVLCGLAALVLLKTRPEKMPSTPPNAAGGIWKVAKAEKSKLLTLGFAASTLTLMRATKAVGLPLWALHIHLPVSTTALIIAMGAAIDFALFYTGGQIVDRVGRRVPAIYTSLAMGISVMAIGLITDAVSFAALTIFFAISNGVGSGMVMVLGSDLAPKGARNEFLATFRLMVDFGVASAAPAISILTLLIGLAGGFVAIGTISFAGAWVMWRYMPKFGIK